MIFVDTGAFLARYVLADQHHAESLAAWENLAKDPRRLFTSNLILSETFTLLGRRAGYAFAAERARNILDSREMTVLRPTEEQERAALGWFEKFADQKVSYTDCVSFALMRHHRLPQAFTFDRHFHLAGFELWR